MTVREETSKGNSTRAAEDELLRVISLVGQKLEGETLGERLAGVRQDNEKTAKWLAAINIAMDRGVPCWDMENFRKSREYEQKLGELLWQTARLVHEVKVLAEREGRDIAEGLGSLKEAIGGTLYNPTAGE